MARGDERLGWRTAVPVSLLAGGGIYAYSYGALLFIAFVALFVLGGEVLRRRELFSVVGRWWRAAVGAVVAAAIVIYPEIDRIQDFRDSIFGQESLRNKGNLAHALNPFESLGVWFNGDFRFNPDPRWPTTVFVVIALGALVASVVFWWRRRSLALPAAVLGAILVWVQLTQTVNIYNAAKGLIVLAPLVMACLGAPLALAWSAHGRGVCLARAVGVVLFAGAVISSGGILRSAPVGLGSHDQEFAAIRDVVRDKPVVFINNDHFAEWSLRGGKPLYVTNSLYGPKWLKQSKWKSSPLPTDVDYYDSSELDRVDYLVVEGGRYRSETPPNFRVALRTPSYEVYRRVGPTPVRQPIEPPGQPGLIFDCNDGFAPQRLKDFKWAGVMPQPIVSTNWRGSIARPGDSARMKLTLPRGRWDVSIQYVSTTPLTFKAPGVNNKLAPNFGLITNYWPAGTVTSNGQPITMTLTRNQRTWFAKLLGQPRGTRTALSPGNNPLFHWAFTRHGQGTRRVPIRQACGRYVDWLAPADSSMRGRRDER
jgi:hypothetical protein